MPSLTRDQRANAASEVLGAVGWQDVLRPELYRLREQLRDAAIASQLDQPHPLHDASPTALAALAWATDKVIDMVEKIVGRGVPPDRGETVAAVQEMLKNA